MARHFQFWLPSDFLAVSVSGRCRTILPGRVGDDHALAQIVYRQAETKAETLGSFEVGEMFRRHEDRLEVEIFGTTGSISWSHLRPYELLCWLDKKEVRLIDGRDFKTPASFHPPEHPPGFIDCWIASYMGILGRIIVACRLLKADELPAELTVPVSSLGDALQNMAFLETLYQSSGQDGAPVNPQVLLSNEHQG